MEEVMSDEALTFEATFDDHRVVRLVITGDDITSSAIRQLNWEEIRQQHPWHGAVADLAYIRSHVPKRGRGADNSRFWRAFSDAYRHFAHTRRPLAELAEALGVSRNRVKGWTIQARRLGYLEPTSGKGRLS